MASSALRQSSTVSRASSNGMPSSPHSSSTTRKLTPLRMESRGGERTAAAADDQEVGGGRLGDEAVGVEEQGGGAGFDASRFLVGDPAGDAAALLDARIDAGGGDVADGRHDEDGAVADETVVAGEGEGEGVNAEGGRAVAGAAGFAEVVADGSGRGEEDHGKVAVGAAAGRRCGRRGVRPRRSVRRRKPSWGRGRVHNFGGSGAGGRRGGRGGDGKCGRGR